MKHIIAGIIIPLLVHSLTFTSSTTTQTNESLEDGYIGSHPDLKGLDVLFYLTFLLEE